MVIPLGIVPSINDPKFLFKITLDARQRVYMAAYRGNYQNDERFVVLVDSARFLEMWRTSAVDDNGRYLAFQTSEQWKRDYKYKYAEAGFSSGICSPVPPARVSSYSFKKRHLFSRASHQIAFSDGLTRTIYMLANGAKSFPVECDANSAEHLFQHAGLQEWKPRSFSSLIPVDYSDPGYLVENGLIDNSTHLVDKFKIVRGLYPEQWLLDDIRDSSAKNNGI